MGMGVGRVWLNVALLLPKTDCSLERAINQSLMTNSDQIVCLSLDKIFRLFWNLTSDLTNVERALYQCATHTEILTKNYLVFFYRSKLKYFGRILYFKVAANLVNYIKAGKHSNVHKK